MKNLNKYLAVLFLFSASLFFSSCDKSTDDTVEPTTATIAKAGKVYSSIYLEKTNRGLLSVVVGEVKPGQSVLILENRNWDYKIQLSDGTMGWIESEYLKPSKHTFIMYQSDRSNIVSSPAAEDREIVKEVTEKTAVTRLEEYQEVKKVKGKDDYVTYWTKVRTEDGIEGWFESAYLYQVPIDPMRFINRKDWSFSMKDFLEEWKGEPIEKFTEKFKKPSGIKITDSLDIYYFHNIFLFKLNKKYSGVRVYVKDSLIENIDAAFKKTSWVWYLPLSSTLRINWIGNYIGNYKYLFESPDDIDGTTTHIKEYVPEWANYVIGILALLIYLVILFYILKIPFTIVNKITYKQSLNRKLFNGRIMLYATLGSIILGYLFSVIMLVNVFPFNDYFFITALFCGGMIIGTIGKWRNDLDYNRCNAADCHQWTGEHSWTEDLGGETVTRTYNDGQTRKQTTRRYREHRICSACGYKWSIIRTNVIGGLKY